MRRTTLLAALAASLLSGAATAENAAGTEFQVNTYTTSDQASPAVAAAASGDFVVVWQSSIQDVQGGIFGQRFSSRGVEQGTEFQVNTYTTNLQDLPSVAVDSQGNVLVVWRSASGDGASYGIFGRLFSSSGTAIGSDFQINTYTTGPQQFSAVAPTNDGFVVVWHSYGQDGSYNGVFGRRVSTSGAVTGSEFQVNTHTPDSQIDAAVASGVDGNFVVVWQSYRQDTDGWGIFGQRFSNSAVKQGTEFPVNTYTKLDEVKPAVAADAAGDFIVAWQRGQSGSVQGIFGQRFSSSGALLGSEFQVSSATTSGQGVPSIASDGDGNFVVTWSNLQDGSGTGVFGKRFSSSGAAIGSEFQVNVYTTGAQSSPAVAADAAGDFVVVWQSSGQDGSGRGVFGRLFDDLIFRDGFESGDLSAWSSSSTDGGDLSVSGAAALASTSFGLSALVNDTAGINVVDDSPQNESRYRVRFYFDPNGFDPGESAGHERVRILIAFDDLSQRVITLVLRRVSGAYSLKGRVRLDDGTRADTPFVPINDGPNAIEFDWQRASSPTANDGAFELFIGGVSAATLTGLDNNSSGIDFTRMGPASLKSGAGGTLYFDEFESRRERYIGLLP